MTDIFFEGILLKKHLVSFLGLALIILLFQNCSPFESSTESPVWLELETNDVLSETESSSSEQGEETIARNTSSSETENKDVISLPKDGEGSENPSERQRKVRLLPLGDSITNGVKNYPSYRRSLWHKLIEADLAEFDFVGSSSEFFRGGVNSALDDFDRDHEGHWGWEANQILAKLPGWLESDSPDVVLMHLGTNDFARGHSNQSTVDELDKIVSLLRSKNTNIIIFVAQIIPMKRKDPSSLNLLIKKWVPRVSTVDSPVILVDQYSGFNKDTDLYDNYHPNKKGEEKMAEIWFQEISKIDFSR